MANQKAKANQNPKSKKSVLSKIVRKFSEPIKVALRLSYVEVPEAPALSPSDPASEAQYYQVQRIVVENTERWLNTPSSSDIHEAPQDFLGYYLRLYYPREATVPAGSHPN